jgi:hypothetical protein
MNEDMFLLRKVDSQILKNDLYEIFCKCKQDIGKIIRTYSILSVLGDDKNWFEE